MTYRSAGRGGQSHDQRQYAQKLANFGHVVSEICKRTNRQTGILISAVLLCSYINDIYFQCFSRTVVLRQKYSRSTPRNVLTVADVRPFFSIYPHQIGEPINHGKLAKRRVEVDPGQLILVCLRSTQ